MSPTGNGSVLNKAIQGGDHARVEKLLELNATLVDARDENGLAAVLVALYYN
jgi:hypothetical protein